MAKPTIFLVAVALAVVLEVGLSGPAGHPTAWGQRSVYQVGFDTGKCASLSGLLPDPKTGCCGRHAGADDFNAGDEEDNSDDESNESDDEDSETDDGNNENDDDDNETYDGNSGSNDGDNSQITGFNAKSMNENVFDIAPSGYITAGKKAGLRQYPWVVHLNIKVWEVSKSSIITCGGSLISSRFVLTAAHCFDEYQSLDDVSIFLAEYNTKNFPFDCVGVTCIKNVVMHPDKIIMHKEYDSDMLTNDIALMRLRGLAPYTEFIRPICLPPFNIGIRKNHGTPLSIAGWGRTSDELPSSPIKLTARVKLVSHKRCQRSYVNLTSSHICAASNNGQDTCRGDSGGPIMAERDGNYYVVGITSAGAPNTTCGSSVPSLYTNVYKFRKWIHDNMKV